MSVYRLKAKYLHIKRESLRLNLPSGTKDLWKDYAADRGMSVTELITPLIANLICKWFDNNKQQ